MNAKVCYVNIYLMHKFLLRKLNNIKYNFIDQLGFVYIFPILRQWMLLKFKMFYMRFI